MENLLKKFVSLRIFRDFYDEEWRIVVEIGRWELARFRVDPLSGKPEKVKDGWY